MSTEPRCGFTLVDADDEEYPCDAPAPSWRWYQGHDHEDALDVACLAHETPGGIRMRELEAALADRDATIVRVRALHKVTLVPSPGEPFKVCLECLDDNGANNIDWPCPTIRALDGGAS